MRGRLRKPSRQRQLDGNPGRRPVPDEPDLPRSELRAPAWLNRDGRKFWDGFLPQLRTSIFAANIDEPLLAVLCASYGLAMAAARKMRREGLVVDGHKHPAAQIWRDNASLFQQIAARFGMSPADRARLFAGEKPKGEVPVPGSTLDGNWIPDQSLESEKRLN